MRFLFVIVLWLLFGCTNSEKKQLQISDDVFAASIPGDSGVNYFPKGVDFGYGANKVSIDSFVKRWYSDVLYNFHEPVLYNYAGNAESVRFLLLPSFGNAVVVRLSQLDGIVYAKIKELSTASSENTRQRVKVDTLLVIEPIRWQEMISRLTEHDFWIATASDSSSQFSKDGTTWLLECRLKDRYHCIERWDNGSLASSDMRLFAGSLMEIAKTTVSIGSEAR
ncbi:MAG: hypothetical protein LCH51_04155 [Bacteroidetes bacterium]|nr:hypothetical protein [Bacteroidota bacterium]